MNAVGTQHLAFAEHLACSRAVLDVVPALPT